ncbi:hypothetical protein MLD38_026042 [Melastoma candidum]|uniref:Uncharacterized protein n=1 Tax=Melastoma candidum TaxID=119954 RepID=A0ACB9NZ52_9MYRT|nr:hypothetical protein MLD38_026042 [Melastoma candidum]
MKLKPPPISLFSARKLCFLFLFFLLLLLIPSIFFLRHPSPAPAHAPHQLFLSASTNATLSSFLRSLTLLPHLSPSPSHLRLLLSLLPSSSSFLLSSSSFLPLLSYPSSISLSLSTSPSTSTSTSSFPLPLSEPSLPPSVVPPYHAFSPSASLPSLLPVFVNFGRPSDYSLLSSLGVSVHGRLALARRGPGISRAGVIRQAEAEGAAAVLLFREDGNRGGVERGTVMSGVGDALTPGWGAKEVGEVFLEEEDEVRRRFPGIPSLPVSRLCAEMVLGELRGATVPEKWREEGLKLAFEGVGPGPIALNFIYKGENKRMKIEDVFAMIRGSEESDRYILLGNHRDAWTYGAVDPSSGTAALLDIARRFNLMTRNGWKPRRTIVLCSWDAEEFGMIGSTEWVEQNLVNAGSKVVAYLNVDCAVQGAGFFASATPQLDDLLVEVTKMVMDPDRKEATIFETWAEADGNVNIERLNRADSDFAPFLQHAGVPSIDIYFGQDYPAYHTAYDTYEWMSSHGDPMFKRHVAAAEIWGLLALRLADDPILPFNYIAYVTQLQRYVDILQSTLDQAISLHPLTSSMELLESAARDATEEAQNLREQKYDGEFGALRRRAMNDRLMHAERGFLDPDGIPERRWFKHLVFGPPANEESKIQFFPGVADAVSRSARMGRKEGLAAVQHEVWRLSRAIERAAIALKGDLL